MLYYSKSRVKAEYENKVFIHPFVSQELRDNEAKIYYGITCLSTLCDVLNYVVAYNSDLKQMYACLQKNPTLLLLSFRRSNKPINLELLELYTNQHLEKPVIITKTETKIKDFLNLKAEEFLDVYEINFNLDMFENKSKIFDVIKIIRGCFNYNFTLYNDSTNIEELNPKLTYKIK
jgi:hypothetical protein